MSLRRCKNCTDLQKVIQRPAILFCGALYAETRYICHCISDIRHLPGASVSCYNKRRKDIRESPHFDAERRCAAMKKGLLLCILTFLAASLLSVWAYYGDRLIEEFRYTERVETLPVDEISSYNPNDTDGIYLYFRYHDPETGKEYSSTGIYTQNKSYQVGDPVEVVTRDRDPRFLLCQTKRARQRTAAERAFDVGTDCGMVVPILVLTAVLLLLGIPNRKMIAEECRKRKAFVVPITVIYGLIITFASFSWILAVHNDNNWDGLVYAFMSVHLFLGGNLVLLISWIVHSVRFKKRAARQA